MVKTTYAVALGVEQDVKLWAKIMLSSVAAGITTGIIALLIPDSLIWTGSVYFVASIGCHVAVALMKSGGSPFHTLTGVLYDVCTDIKERLITTKNFAAFLNDLASQGICEKIIQMALILLCVGAMVFLGYILCKCVITFVKSIISLINQDDNNHPKPPTKKRKRKNKKTVKVQYIDL